MHSSDSCLPMIGDMDGSHRRLRCNSYSQPNVADLGAGGCGVLDSNTTGLTVSVTTGLVMKLTPSFARRRMPRGAESPSPMVFTTTFVAVRRSGRLVKVPGADESSICHCKLGVATELVDRTRQTTKLAARTPLVAKPYSGVENMGVGTMRLPNSVTTTRSTRIFTPGSSFWPSAAIYTLLSPLSKSLLMPAAAYVPP